ncbi:recombinase family protein [Neobacillus mesonae]|uniref:recombinase family protein n=1 Tax=Neobacillus mesonae TaxID=1193713 RepID=UPI00082E02DD|nr:recombinase family protein [Neobacillus mesonae]
MVKQYHVAIFNRKSRNEGDTDETLRNHRQITIRLCEEKGYTYDNYEEIISGASKFEERKELIRLLENVDKGMYDAVVTVEVSRLARSGQYSQIIADTLAENNVLIITPKETIDLTIDSQRLLYDIQAAVNSNEYRVIRNRMRTGMIEKAKRGEYVSAKAPFGYDAVIKNKIRTLQPNENASTVKFCYDLAEKGYGMKQIVKELNLRGLKSSSGGKFAFKSVQNILKNKQYTGTNIFKLSDKKGNITNVIEVPDAFTKIVSLEQWLKVQDAIKERTSGDNEVRNRARGEVRTILKDLLYCSNCGAKIGFQFNPARNLMVKKCRCGMRGITEQALLEYFWDELISVEKHFRKEWEKALEISSEGTAKEITLQIDALNSSKSKLNKKLKRARDEYLDGVFTKEEYLSDKADIEKEIQEVESNIVELEKRLLAVDTEGLRKKLQDRVHWIEEVKRITKKRQGKLTMPIGEEMPAVQPEDFPEVNRLLKLVIDKIYYRRDDEHTWVDEEGNVEVTKEIYVHLNITTK